MFHITEKALRYLREHAYARAARRRIHLSPRGCTYPKVTIEEGMPTESDVLLIDDGYTFFMAAKVREGLGEIALDIMYGELLVDTQIPYRAEGCGVCSAAGVNGGQCGKAPGYEDVPHM